MVLGKHFIATEKGGWCKPNCHCWATQQASCELEPRGPVLPFDSDSASRGSSVEMPLCSKRGVSNNCTSASSRKPKMKGLRVVNAQGTSLWHCSSCLQSAGLINTSAWRLGVPGMLVPCCFWSNFWGLTEEQNICPGSELGASWPSTLSLGVHQQQMLKEEWKNWATGISLVAVPVSSYLWLRSLWKWYLQTRKAWCGVLSWLPIACASTGPLSNGRAVWEQHCKAAFPAVFPCEREPGTAQRLQLQSKSVRVHHRPVSAVPCSHQQCFIPRIFIW